MENVKNPEYLTVCCVNISCEFCLQMMTDSGNYPSPETWSDCSCVRGDPH